MSEVNDSTQSNGQHDASTSHTGFRINYNFNTHQLREVEIIFVADHKRYGQLLRGDILLQINGRNVDSFSEKELTKYLLNSSNPKAPGEYVITSLTIYRPYIEGHQANQAAADDDDTNDENGHSTSSAQQNDHFTNGNDLNTNGNDTTTTTTTTTTNNNHRSPSTNGNEPKNRLLNGAGNGDAPIGSSTPMRAKEPSSNGRQSDNDADAADAEEGYAIEEIKIVKSNGAMGLSIVGGGNIACHPFGIDKPGIFISKIVPDGPASRTNLRVGDRLLRVNNVDVTQMSHDECVDELKRHAHYVNLIVSHDPQPAGLQEVILHRSKPDETLGIRINGGIENKSANVYDPTDEGIFVVNIINGTLAHRDGRLKVGTRIMEVCSLPY